MAALRFMAVYSQGTPFAATLLPLIADEMMVLMTVRPSARAGVPPALPSLEAHAQGVASERVEYYFEAVRQLETEVSGRDEELAALRRELAARDATIAGLRRDVSSLEERVVRAQEEVLVTRARFKAAASTAAARHARRAARVPQMEVRQRSSR